MTETSLRRTLHAKDLLAIEPLLEDILEEGRRKSPSPAIEEIRSRRQSDMVRLDTGVNRLMNPHIYHVSLSEKMWQMKQALIAAMRAGLPQQES